MRVIRAIDERRGAACDNALSIVLRAVFKNTGLIPELHDAYPVCKLRQNLENRR